MSLAHKLISAAKFSEALTELVKSFRTRQDEGWRVNNTLIAIAKKLVANGTAVLADNKPLYR